MCAQQIRDAATQLAPTNANAREDMRKLPSQMEPRFALVLSHVLPVAEHLTAGVWFFLEKTPPIFLCQEKIPVRITPVIQPIQCAGAGERARIIGVLVIRVTDTRGVPTKFVKVSQRCTTKAMFVFLNVVAHLRVPVSFQ